MLVSGPMRAECHRPLGCRSQRVDQERHRVPVLGCEARRRQARAFEAVGAAYVLRCAQRAQQRLARAGKHGHVVALRELRGCAARWPWSAAAARCRRPS